MEDGFGEKMWRQAEACNNELIDLPQTSDTLPRRTALLEEGMAATEQCIAKAPHLSPSTLGECHKWFASLAAKWGELQGTKAKILNSHRVLEHANKACELLPTDSVANHLMGAVYFNVAQLSWIEKKVASAVFAKVPEHTFEEAVVYLERADRAEPNFIRNSLMLGQAYDKMKRPEEAKKWYQHCAAMTARSVVEEEQLSQCKKHV
eukprot:Sspe_Gene.10514::Locus_3519_Transcript_2_2_Confidence_0.750_Length_1362::g.10514::m.10514